jgi:hypothetical protein
MRPEDAALWAPDQPVRIVPTSALRGNTAIPLTVDFLDKGRFMTLLLIVLGTTFFAIVLYDLERAPAMQYRSWTKRENIAEASLMPRPVYRKARRVPSMSSCLPCQQQSGFVY